MNDLADRLDNRVQLSSDALAANVDATSDTVGDNVDFERIIKHYEAEPASSGRYSLPRVFSATREVNYGDPEQKHISTSYVERQNLTMRRFTRLTNAFSKKIENLRVSFALHFAHYNLVRVHKTLRCTPGMATSVVSNLWSMEELVDRVSN